MNNIVYGSNWLETWPVTDIVFFVSLWMNSVVLSHSGIVLEQVAYLLNIRGSDITHCPVAISYLIVTSDGASLFIDPVKISSKIESDLKVWRNCQAQSLYSIERPTICRKAYSVPWDVPLGPNSRSYLALANKVSWAIFITLQFHGSVPLQAARVEIHAYEEALETLRSLAEQGKRIWIDQDRVNYAFFNVVPKERWIHL